MAQTLKLGSTPWLPFTGEKGGPRLVIELVEEALSRAGIDSHVTIVREGSLTPQIKAKKLDGSPAMWRDDERDKFLEFSAPLLENRLMLVGKKGADVRAKDLGTLGGKRIGIVEGYAYGDAVEKAKEVKFVRGVSHQDNLSQLLAGSLDYVLIEDLLLNQMLMVQAKDIKDHLETGEEPLLVRSLHFALRKDVPNAVGIMQKFNSEIKRMQTDGTYNRILKMNWISIDANGDGKPELVSSSGRVGKKPPESGYKVFYSNLVKVAASGYLVEGSVYEDWAHVPEKNKVDNTEEKYVKPVPVVQWKF